MKRTYLVYREGDAGTEQHLAVVSAFGYTEDRTLPHPRRFVDDEGLPVLFVSKFEAIKVRLVREGP